MATQTDRDTPRVPLSRERVLRAAIDLAGRRGLDSISMRKVGQELGVEAMSLYNHVANKEDLLDGMIDVIVSEIELVEPGDDWKAAMRSQIMAARAVMLRHRWASTVIESRTTISPILMIYFNGLLRLFRAGGFSYDLAHHAMHVLGSRALGFSQELFEPGDDGAKQADEDAGRMLEQMAEQLPYMVEMMTEIMAHNDGPDETLGWCDDQTEFKFALDLILDGLERRRDAE